MNVENVDCNIIKASFHISLDKQLCGLAEFASKHLADSATFCGNSVTLGYEYAT